MQCQTVQSLTLLLSGACDEDVATSTSRSHAGLSIACRQTKVERAQIILYRSQPGLPRSSSSSSPVFGRTTNAGPESSGVVLTGLELKERELQTAAVGWENGHLISV